MRIVVAEDTRPARQAAEEIAAAVRTAVAARGEATLALSGGPTADELLDALAGLPLPWDRLHLFQVDERAAPAGHPDRNVEPIRRRLLPRVSLADERVHPMPVEGPDLEAAAARYAETLRSHAGVPVVLDVVHLGIGADGHTASLVPDDPVLDIVDRDVAVSRTYEGWRRLTLTFPTLARARSIVWLVRGDDKRAAVGRLLAGDPAVPASRVPSGRSVLVLDPAADPRHPIDPTT